MVGAIIVPPPPGPTMVQGSKRGAGPGFVAASSSAGSAHARTLSFDMTVILSLQTKANTRFNWLKWLPKTAIRKIISFRFLSDGSSGDNHESTPIRSPFRSLVAPDACGRLARARPRGRRCAVQSHRESGGPE